MVWTPAGTAGARLSVSIPRFALYWGTNSRFVLLQSVHEFSLARLFTDTSIVAILVEWSPARFVGVLVSLFPSAILLCSALTLTTQTEGSYYYNLCMSFHLLAFLQTRLSLRYL